MIESSYVTIRNIDKADLRAFNGTLGNMSVTYCMIKAVNISHVTIFPKATRVCTEKDRFTWDILIRNI